MTRGGADVRCGRANPRSEIHRSQLSSFFTQDSTMLWMHLSLLCMLLLWTATTTTAFVGLRHHQVFYHPHLHRAARAPRPPQAHDESRSTPEEENGDEAMLRMSTTGGRSSKPRGRRTAAWAACPRRPSKPPRPVRVPCGRRFGTVAVAVAVASTWWTCACPSTTGPPPHPTKQQQSAAAAAAAAQSVVRRSTGRRVWRGARGAAVLLLIEQ